MKTYDVNLPYHEIQAREERWQKTYRFETVDRTPVLTPYHSRYFVSMLGLSPETYFWDPEVMLSTQMFWKAWVLNNIQSDFYDLQARVDQGHYTESWALGCELAFKGSEPWIKTAPVQNERDLDALARIDILDNPAVAHEESMRPQMAAMAGDYRLRFADGTVVYPAENMKPANGTQATFSLATDLRGPEIFLDIKLRPDFVHRLMDIVTGKVIQRWAWLIETYGYPADTIYLCDDSSAMLSPDDYRQFVLPYSQRFKEHFKASRTILHCCGAANHLVPIWADELGVEVMWNFSFETDRRKIAQTMSGRTVLLGNVNWKTVYQGGPDEVYRDALDVLDTFAPHGGHVLSTTNIPPGTPVEHVNAMHRAAVTYQQNSHGAEYEPTT